MYRLIWLLLKQSRKGVPMQSLDQQNQFALPGEAFGVKAVGRRGGGVLPDLGLGYTREVYEKCVKCQRKALGLCWAWQTYLSLLCGSSLRGPT
mgnify:FL=1